MCGPIAFVIPVNRSSKTTGEPDYDKALAAI